MRNTMDKETHGCAEKMSVTSTEPDKTAGFRHRDDIGADLNNFCDTHDGHHDSAYADGSIAYVTVNNVQQCGRLAI